MSLAYQLTRTFPLYKGKLEHLGLTWDKLSNKAEMNLMNLFDVLLGGPLNDVPPPPIDPRTGKRRKYVIVIDAIDECGTARDEQYAVGREEDPEARKSRSRKAKERRERRARRREERTKLRNAKRVYHTGAHSVVSSNEEDESDSVESDDSLGNDAMSTSAAVQALHRKRRTATGGSAIKRHDTRKHDSDILECIRRHFTKLPPWLGLVVTTRSGLGITEQLAGFNPTSLQFTVKQNVSDIRSFLRRSLQGKLRAEPTESAGNPGTSVERWGEKAPSDSAYLHSMAEHLVKSSKGQFLYANKAVLRLSTQASVEQDGLVSGRRIKQYPDGLHALFGAILTDIALKDYHPAPEVTSTTNGKFKAALQQSGQGHKLKSVASMLSVVGKKPDAADDTDSPALDISTLGETEIQRFLRVWQASAATWNIVKMVVVSQEPLPVDSLPELTGRRDNAQFAKCVRSLAPLFPIRGGHERVAMNSDEQKEVKDQAAVTVVRRRKQGRREHTNSASHADDSYDDFSGYSDDEYEFDEEGRVSGFDEDEREMRMYTCHRSVHDWLLDASRMPVENDKNTAECKWLPAPRALIVFLLVSYELVCTRHSHNIFIY